MTEELEMWGGSGGTSYSGWRLPRIFDWPKAEPETRFEGQDGPVNIDSIFFNPTSPASKEKIQKNLEAIQRPAPPQFARFVLQVLHLARLHEQGATGPAEIIYVFFSLREEEKTPLIIIGTIHQRDSVASTPSSAQLLHSTNSHHNDIIKMSAVCMPNVGQESLNDRVSKLLESFEWSDVTFQVGTKTIKAHKLILAISSPVFKVMLYGALPELNEIVIADIEPDVFQLMIDFIYKDKVDIDSLKTACELMYAAKKYMLPSLTDTCIKYISEQLHVQNILTILPFAEWIQEETLILHCLKLISNHAEFILTKKTPHITAPSLLKILQQDAINICERDLIKFALHWAHNECLERRLPPTDNNKRTMLDETGNFLELRFLTLTLDDLDWLSSLNILTKAEKEYVKNNIISNNATSETKVNETDDKKCEKEEKIAFDMKSDLVSDELFDDLLDNDSAITEENYKPAINLTMTGRSQAKINWILCCRPQIRSASPLIIKNGFQNIKVTIRCDKTILVNSFSIPTRQSAEMILYHETKGYYKENIKMEVYGTYKYLEQTSTHFISTLCYNSSTYVQLPKPFLMKELEWYTISFTWPELNNSPFKYALCYRPALSTDNLFMFNDNFENSMPCGSFIEGLKIYL